MSRHTTPRLSVFATLLIATACQGSTTLPGVVGAAMLQVQAAVQGPVQPVSPARQRIAAAKQQIAAFPRRAQAYDELTLAYIRRSRETGDPAYYHQAEAALKAGQQLAPGDFQLEKASLALLLARRRFPEAQARARELNKKNPDDVTIYGYLAEADLALGNYAEAEQSAQWMLNMRPNNKPGLLAGAELRLAYGDPAGALEFLNQAFGETPQTETEEQAWLANRIAAVDMESGHLAAAAQALARAEELYPQSPVTQENLARLRMAQQKPLEAVTLLEKRVAEEQARHAPQAATLFLLANAEGEAGRPEAAATFARFEETAQAAIEPPASGAVPSNKAALSPGAASSHEAALFRDDVDLILYYAGLPGEPPRNAAEALTLATQQVAVRQDTAMLDAYAWALYANGRYAQADAEAKKALAVGIHTASLDEHAGEIALKLNNPGQATADFAAAMEADAASPYSEQARRLLGSQPAGTASQSSGAVSPAPAEGPAPAQPSRDLSTTQATQLTPAAQPSGAPVQWATDTGELPSTLLIPRPTGTDRAIKKMQALVSARPTDPATYSGLGAAFFQRARETGDVQDYNLAEQALTKSLDIVSTDLSATQPLETMAEVCMGEHRFTDALEYAQKALALGSGDLSAFATVGDAYADMGQYEKASIAYARLQPLSPGPSEAHSDYAQQTRTAYLKFVAGDTDAAIAEMQAAVSEAIQARLPAENLAWLYFELGEFYYQRGSIQPAATAYLTSLNAYPGDYRALAGLAKVRASQGKYAQAITLYQSAIAVVPMPLYIAELGDIYQRIGNASEAEKQYKLVEYIGMLGHINQVLHNRDLALFYADHNRNLPEALTLARKEFEVRSDIYTWDALAWALYQNGKYAEADEAMTHALRLGTRDAMLLFHAGMIAARLGQPARAANQLQAAVAINPHFHVLYAEQAREQLSALHQPALDAATSTASGLGASAGTSTGSSQHAR